MQTSFESASNAIVKLRWDKNFAEALHMYRNQIHGKFSRDEICGNHKLIGAIADCLKETGKIQEAVKMIENIWQIDFQTLQNPSLLTNFSWIYFFAFDAEKRKALQNNRSRTEIVIRLLNHTVQTNPKLAGLLFFRYIETLAGMLTPDWMAVANLFKLYSHETFSNEPGLVTIQIKGEPKETPLASDREKWFVWKTKALFAINQWEACIDTCKEALESIGRFHHGNQHWITRRMAQSFRQMGDTKQAIHEFEKLLQKRSDWFIEKELAEIYFQQNDIEKALPVAIQACVNKGYSDYKTGLFQLAGQIYLAANQASEACRMFWLASLIRQQQQWKIPAELEAAVAGCPPLPQKTAEALYDTIISEWKKTGILDSIRKSQSEKALHGNGKITRILHSGSNGDGFITDTEGRSIYFRFGACKIPVDEIIEGIEVGFSARAVERKNKKVFNATKVYKGKVVEK
jgi:tetratricopeptide (TPR) repeat protein